MTNKHHSSVVLLWCSVITYSIMLCTVYVSAVKSLVIVMGLHAELSYLIVRLTDIVPLVFPPHNPEVAHKLLDHVAHCHVMQMRSGRILDVGTIPQTVTIIIIDFCITDGHAGAILKLGTAKLDDAGAQNSNQLAAKLGIVGDTVFDLNLMVLVNVNRRFHMLLSTCLCGSIS